MIIEGGYYIKARCIKHSFIAHASPCLRETFDYLLREASHTEKKYEGFTLKRGQLFRTYQEIRDDLSWKVGFRIKRYNEDAMKHTMKTLRDALMITLTKTPRGMIITVCNYDFYQDPKNYERANEHANEDPMNARRTREEPLSINKNIKNIIIEDSDTHIPEKGEKAQRSGKKKEPPFVLPEWIPEETWNAYLAAREKRKVANTTFALNLIIKKLIKLRDEFNNDPIEVLNESIQSGYPNIYPLKRGGNNEGKREYRWDGTGNAPKDTKFRVLSGEIASEPDTTKPSIHPGEGEGISTQRGSSTDIY